MKKCFVFCHGFGFDKNFWKNLIPYFLNQEYLLLDLGYFGEKDLEINFALKRNLEFIGIGHSLGFIKLINSGISFTHLIGLNAFINFLGSEPKLKSEREERLCKLKYSLDKIPIATLHQFYKNCKVFIDENSLSCLHKTLLIQDLDLLFSRFVIPEKIPVLIIGAQDDIVVPSSIIYDNFAKRNVNKNKDKILILNHGAHGLGFFEANKVYAEITNFIE